MTTDFVGGLDWGEPVYESVNWDSTERPTWWISDSLIWELHLSTGKQFVTSNLEQAALQLAERLRRPLAEVREELVRSTPLTPGAQATHSDWQAVCHARRPFLRSQVERLSQLEAALNAYREGVITDVLTDFINAVERDDVATLLDPASVASYLGINARTLKAWAIEFDAYEVSEFLRGYKKPEAAATPSEPAQQSADKEHEALIQAHRMLITRFSGYFNAHDFNPRNAHEAEALALHRRMRAATSAAEEERLLKERDLYLINFVFEKA